MALIASLSACNTQALYVLRGCVCACVFVIVSSCACVYLGYICQYELVSLEAECWACCVEINSAGRWQIVESEISLLQKPLQLHQPYTKYALLQEFTLDWGRRGNPYNTLICAYFQGLK